MSGLPGESRETAAYGDAMLHKISIDAMLPSDLPFVVEIERESQPEPWSRNAFAEELANSLSVCFVARHPRDCAEGVHAGPQRFRKLPGDRILEQETRRFRHSPRWTSALSSFGFPQRVTQGSPGIRTRRNMGICYGCVKSPRRIMGYICFWVVADELHVLNVAVHKACRRRGVGRVLVLRAIQEGRVRGVRKALLEVRSSNVDARSFYQSLGFQIVGERPGYYGRNGEPAVLMDLVLGDTANDRPRL